MRKVSSKYLRSRSLCCGISCQVLLVYSYKESHHHYLCSERSFHFSTWLLTHGSFHGFVISYHKLCMYHVLYLHQIFFFSVICYYQSGINQFCNKYYCCDFHCKLFSFHTCFFLFITMFIPTVCVWILLFFSSFMIGC